MCEVTRVSMCMVVLQHGGREGGWLLVVFV